MITKFLNIASNYVLPIGATDTILDDPVSGKTRKTKKTLLLVSLIAFYVTYAKTVPTKISALGIEFTSKNQQELLNVSSWVLVYFICSFLIYGFSDYLKWQRRIRDNRISYYKGIQDRIKNDKSDEMSEIRQRKVSHVQEYIDKTDDQSLLLELCVWLTSKIIALLEFIFPVLVGTFAFFCLQTY